MRVSPGTGFPGGIGSKQTRTTGLRGWKAGVMKLRRNISFLFCLHHPPTQCALCVKRFKEPLFSTLTRQAGSTGGAEGWDAEREGREAGTESGEAETESRKGGTEDREGREAGTDSGDFNDRWLSERGRDR